MAADHPSLSQQLGPSGPRCRHLGRGGGKTGVNPVNSESLSAKCDILALYQLIP